MRNLISGIITLAISTPLAAATAVEGVWKTEPNEEGGYLEVTMGPCPANTGKTCGVITAAHNGQEINPDYEHLGKLMVKDMESDDGNSFSGGTIWDPEKDKTYKSNMQLKGGVLDVEGCIAFFCDGQDWTRVN